MDDMFLLMKKLNCFCKLQKYKLCYSFNLSILTHLLILIRTDLVENTVENVLILDIKLLLIVPGRDLTHIG